MIEIQERDEKILNIIGNYGAIYNKDILRDIFDDKKTYYFKRMKKLEDESYLIRKDGMFHLAINGKEYLEGKKIEYRKINVDIKPRRRAAEVYKILSRLKEFEVMPSFKIERLSSNFAYKYYGKAKSKTSEKEYWIYRIGKLKLKEGLEFEDHNEKVKDGKQIEIFKLKNEIKEISQLIKDSAEYKEKNISVIVFVEDRESMKLYKEVDVSMNVAEQILLAYTDSGLDLVNKYIGKGEGTNEKVLEKLKSQGINAELNHKDWKNADFNINGLYGINLTTSDYNKEKMLSNYLSFTQPENIVIVCDSIQKDKYENQFIGCSIIELKN